MKNFKIAAIVVLLAFVCVRGEAKTSRATLFLKKGKAAFQAGKLERSLYLLDKAIRGTKSKKERNLAYYYHGLALFEMGHYYSSYLSFKNVLTNPDPSFKKLYAKAIKNATIIVDRLDIVSSLGQDLLKLSDSYIPPQAASMAHYSKGVYAFEKKKLSVAKGLLKSVHPESQFYVKALFYLGVASTMEKNYKEAEFYFKKIVKLTSGNVKLRAREDIAKLNLARVIYSMGNMEKSVEAFARFTSSSPFWQTVLLEASWPLMRLNDTTVSLGNLHTLTSPFYRENFVGEAYILRSIILFALCKYEEMKHTLSQFFEIYDPLLNELEKESGKLGGPSAYYNSYKNRKGLNDTFLRFLDRDTGVKKILTVQDVLEEEKVDLGRYGRSKTIRAMWKMIESQRTQLSIRLGKDIQSIHKLKLRELKQQREQANYLKVEIITGEKELIEKTKGLPPQRVTDVETNVFEGYQYWPFKGEYWEDELGTYVYTTESSCIN